MVEHFGYCDASGTELGQVNEHVLVTAGVVARVDKWDEFDRRWLETMEKKYGVCHFHMKKFAHFKECFEHGWAGKENEPKRTEFLRDLLTLAKELTERVFVSTLFLNDYRALDGKYCATETLGGAYSYAQASCVVRAFEWMRENLPSDDRVHFWVEHGDPGQEAFRRFIQEQVGFPPKTIDFLRKRTDTDEDITPYHIADFVAYEYHSEHNVWAATSRRKAKTRGALTAIREALNPDVGILRYKSIEQMCLDVGAPLRVVEDQ